MPPTPCRSLSPILWPGLMSSCVHCYNYDSLFKYLWIINFFALYILCSTISAQFLTILLNFIDLFNGSCSKIMMKIIMLLSFQPPDYKSVYCISNVPSEHCDLYRRWADYILHVIYLVEGDILLQPLIIALLLHLALPSFRNKNSMTLVQFLFCFAAICNGYPWIGNSRSCLGHRQSRGNLFFRWWMLY